MQNSLSEKQKAATMQSAKELVEDGLDRLELTRWINAMESELEMDPEELEDDEPSSIGAFRLAVELLGGPPTHEELREYLHERLTQRDASSSDQVQAFPPEDLSWKRQALCRCGVETEQLLHGCTNSDTCVLVGDLSVVIVVGYSMSREGAASEFVSNIDHHSRRLVFFV